MKVCSQVCGVVFDPLNEDYVDVCEECEDNCGHKMIEGENGVTGSYYLGACGLIIDYLL
ncbi:hypothetical protein [Paenibacillus sedimenti]|uniref:Uncharacterized protein n=1 Tax=Paenibacillus sedimenti TaxID=2770274 RepID=A0A926KNB0_9BACL|nr:hypothetical protein [Paenibacillus sedimenti]MBD0380268.1 hypothetical protein [Paenibacillus sedimenti]